MPSDELLVNEGSCQQANAIMVFVYHPRMFTRQLYNNEKKKKTTVKTTARTKKDTASSFVKL